MTNNHSSPKYPLSKKTILSAIDVACRKKSLPHLIWKRCRHPDDPSTILSYRFVGEVKRAVSNSKNIEGEHSTGSIAAPATVPVVQSVVVVASFYLAYSTWDGRILYVDHINTMMDDNNVIAKRDTTEQRPTLLLAVYQILAHIAILLDCTRLTWQHTKEDAIVFPKSCQPETLHGWLTLHWERESIIRFLGGQPPDNSTTTTTPSSDQFRELIERTIQRCNASTTTTAMGSRPNRTRRLRLAVPTDIPSISRLVQGLADYEKEPDAVHVTPDHYRMDGFQSDPPLFHCLLLEEARTTTAVGNVVKTNTVDDWYACGMAFCWMGARQDVSQRGSHLEEDDEVEEGTLVSTPSPEILFLYLEDLFIEEAYRGNGAGTFVMTTLGEIAVSLHCQKMVWQALDWNTPALTFYQNKIGARVVDGLWTTRFAGSSLHEFHVLESEGELGHDQGPN